ncbi:MAG: glycosyltransferase family 2 protein [Clostridia bacterium]|nr:glycosyltransferase family 2 protein [Clostridia bacterium]
MRFSLMIPVYNAEPYLEAALDAVRAQTYTDFEALLIDDGSTDGSASVCDRYAEQDRRFRVWHTENHGVFLARKFAEEHARGEYLLFLDADDLTEPTLLQALNDAVDLYSPDLITFDFSTFRENEAPRLETFLPQDAFLQGGELEVFYRFLLSTRFNSLCIKCFHRRLSACAPDYAAFAGIRHGEDLLRSAYLVCAAGNICYVRRSLYSYRLGPGHSGDFDADSIFYYDRVDREVRRLLAQKVRFDDAWQALFDDLCRKQLDNYLRLLSYGTTPVRKAAALLRDVMRLELSQNALRAADDSLKYRLLRRGRYALLVRLHRGKRWRHAQ